MHVLYQYQVGKIGLDSDAGWVATVDGASGAVFVQRFVFEPKKEYPDGSSVEFWSNGLGSFIAWGKTNEMVDDPVANPHLFESELVGPFARLAPGEEESLSYEWCAATIGGDFPVVDCTDAGVVCAPLRVRDDGGALAASGRFGVFCAGRACLSLLDRDGNDLALAEAPASPLEPLVLGPGSPLIVGMRVPEGAVEAWLSVVDLAGNPVGQLGRAALER
jgi:hypothetical protein